MLKANVQKDLFDGIVFEKRISIEERDFLMGNTELLAHYLAAVYYAHQKLHKELMPIYSESGYMEPNIPATTMNSFIKSYLISKLPFESLSHATNRRFKIKGQGDVWVFSKKLGKRKKMPSNVKTVANDIIMGQLSDNPNDKGANVFLGYTVSDKNFSEILGVFAVCIEGDTKKWHFDVADALAKTAVIKPITNNKNTPKLKEGVVKVKGKRNTGT